MRRKVKPKGHFEERCTRIDDSLNTGDKEEVRSQLLIVVSRVLLWEDGIIMTWVSVKVSLKGRIPNFQGCRETFSKALLQPSLGLASHLGDREGEAGGEAC